MTEVIGRIVSPETLGAILGTILGVVLLAPIVWWMFKPERKGGGS